MPADHSQILHKFYITFYSSHTAHLFFVVPFLAHLSHRLRVSYCHWQMSVVRRPSSTIALNNISSETARPRALIFGM